MNFCFGYPVLDTGVNKIANDTPKLTNCALIALAGTFFDIMEI